MTPNAQPDLQPLEGDPQLLVGWRRGTRLHAGNVPLHTDLTQDLRSICDGALNAIREREERPYEPAAQLESHEQYFLLDVNDLPPPPERRRRHPQFPTEGDLPAELTGVADIVALVRATELEEIPATRLREGSFLFYAIVWSQEDSRIAFIKKSDPVAIVSKGHIFMQYGDTLTRVQRPDLALYGDVDVVVTQTRIYTLNQRAFETLFSDVKVVLRDVPQRITDVSDALPDSLPLTGVATGALVARCRTRASYAVRLRRLGPRLSTIDLTPERIRDAMTRHGEQPAHLLNDNNEFEFGEDEVGRFLDLLEGRWFEDDFSGERRRADRYSTRRS